MKGIEVFARGRTLQELDLYGDELKPMFQPALKQSINEISLT